MAGFRHFRAGGNLEHKQTLAENFLGITNQKMDLQLIDVSY